MPMRVIVFGVMITSLATALGAAPAAAPEGAAKPPATRPAEEPPDLSQYDLPTLRAITGRLFGTLTDAKQRLAANDAEIARLKKENAALTKKFDELKAEVAGQKELIADLKNRLATAPSPPKPASDPGKADAAPDSDAVARKIRDQHENFARLNEEPARHLGKSLTLLGYASATRYSSKGVFNDQDSPRKYLALTNADGDEIYLSYSQEGNGRLSDLLDSDRPRVPLRVEVIGTATRQHAVFEGAIQKWEEIK